MTVKELFETVLSLMFCPISEGDEYREMFINVLNQRIRECRMLNATLREFKGKQPHELKKLSDMSETIEAEDELIAALPYGIAGVILTDEDTTGMANVYRSDYQGLLSDAARAFNDSGEEE